MTQEQIDADLRTLAQHQKVLLELDRVLRRIRTERGWSRTRLTPEILELGQRIKEVERRVQTLGFCAKSARYFQKPRPGSRRRAVRCRHGVRIRECESGHAWDCDNVPGAGSLRQRLLLWCKRLAQTPRPSRALKRTQNSPRR